MGSSIEINDTLQITTEQGFPADVFDLAKHLKTPIKPGDVAQKVFQFHDKPNPRIFQLDPVRVYFVHNVGGKWLFWGRVYIQSQTITKKLGTDGSWKEGDWVTSGSYRVVDVYEPEYQRIFTMRESPAGLSYF
jgi:hypothetical protein